MARRMAFWGSRGQFEGLSEISADFAQPRVRAGKTLTSGRVTW